MLTLAGLLVPVTHSDANGLPLGSEADRTYRKYLLLDSGLMLRWLNLAIGNIKSMTVHILTSSVADLVNKGPIAELITGLEMIRYQSPNVRHELYYWQRTAKNSLAEVDYVTEYQQKVLPVEVKAGTQGGMKSLWLFMREKRWTEAVRCSLENFGAFDYTDKEAGGVIRHVLICPLYAISRMRAAME